MVRRLAGVTLPSVPGSKTRFSRDGIAALAAMLAAGFFNPSATPSS
jgi:hypothetical protein